MSRSHADSTRNARPQLTTYHKMVTYSVHQSHSDDNNMEASGAVWLKWMATVPTNVVLGFKSEEAAIKAFYINFDRYDCRTYVDKPTRCFKCQRYGHIARKCNRQVRCQRCGQQYQLNDCDQDATTTAPLCLHCRGNPITGDKACPKYLHERTVVNCQTTKKITYM